MPAPAKPATQIPDGLVRKSTLYMSVAVALIAGLYLGNVLTSTLGEGKPTVAKKQVSAPSGEQATSQVPPDVMNRILELEQAVIKNPQDASAWTHLGHLYFDTHQAKEAIRAYERSLALAPDDPDVLTDLGVMYRADHQHDRALATFDKAATINPKHEIALFNKGIVLYFDLEKKEEGLAVWRKLLGINPNAKAPDGTPLAAMVKDLSTK